MMDKQQIVSSPATETAGRYAVGVMKDGKYPALPWRLPEDTL